MDELHPVHVADAVSNHRMCLHMAQSKWFWPSGARGLHQQGPWHHTGCGASGSEIRQSAQLLQARSQIANMHGGKPIEKDEPIKDIECTISGGDAE